ncbi:hypothetical protein LINGRAHAP2_LOCUS7433, partial [Linum grandiflorum]
FRRVWRSALVVRGLGKRFPYSVLAPRLNYLWARNGPLNISDLHNGCFLVRFKSKQDYEWVIDGGPWMLAVKRIASRIGHPIRVDRATEEGARGKYARVCVEVDLTKPLLSKYMLEGKKYLISYESLHGLCTVCGMYKSTPRGCYCQAPMESDKKNDDS